MTSKKRSVIYVNYTPYENSGKTLDYLLENFGLVVLFSIGHQNLGDKRRTNRFQVYQDGKAVRVKQMLFMPVPANMVFLFLPVRAILNLLQLTLESWKLRLKYGRFDVYFSVNGYTNFVGLILRMTGVVGKVIYWVWDYYPIRHESLVVTVMRWAYWQFDKLGKYADRLIFLNGRLMNLWKEKGVVPRDEKYSLVAIGTDEVRTGRVNKTKVRLGFIGVVKKSQGLDMIFNSASALNKSFPGIVFEVIGSGQDEKYFKKRAKESGLTTNFHGYVTEKEFERVLKGCTIGIAPYVPAASNVSFYGDPGKVKRYIGFAKPAIITDVFEFSKELAASGAGEVVKYDDSRDLVRVIKKIMGSYGRYCDRAEKLNKKFYYRDIYPEMFRV